MKGFARPWQRGHTPGKWSRGDGRGDWIRTSDFLLPKQALYQAELRPGVPRKIWRVPGCFKRGGDSSRAPRGPPAFSVFG